MDTTLTTHPMDSQARQTSHVAHRGRRLRKVVVAALLVGSLTLAVAPAGALTVSKNVGSPGKVINPRTAGAWIDQNRNVMVAGGRTVSESPKYANRIQYVCVTPRLWLLLNNNGGPQTWSRDAQLTQCRSISAAARSVALGGVAFGELVPYFAYKTDVVVTWRLTNRSGKVIGQRIFNYNLRADYECQSSGCRIGTSRIGAYMMFDF
jgi:hypothetical protein